MRIAKILTIFACMTTVSNVSATEPQSAGGSNYIVVNVDQARLNGNAAAWRDNKIFKTPVCNYSNERAAIHSDLSSMLANGQRRVALVLWHARLDAGMTCSGFLVNSRDGKLPDNQLQGLGAIIDDASTIGFQEVHIRFGPMWVNSPSGWTDWKEDLYLENRNFMIQVCNFMKRYNIKIVIDLGVELGGLTDSKILERYVTTIGDDFCRASDEKTSFMFTIASQKGRLERYLAWMKNTPCSTNIVYIDIYTDAKQRIEVAADEARRSGIARPQFVIEETLYADGDEFRELIDGAKSMNADILYIMQWPIKRSNGKEILATTPLYLYGPR